ncbi:MAG TPA: hypothetical protein DHV17_08970 [Chitinophagaceae bacterium]|nr:hypothetical protein [Chitinophagaceae bacterium]
MYSLPLQNLRYHIIAEHEDFVAIDKPSGMLSIPDRTQSEPSLKDKLMERYGKILTVHRIDRYTSGLILFARTEAMHQYLCGLFENRGIRKFYSGVVLGMPPKAEGLIDAPIMEDPAHAGRMMVHRNGKPAQTGYTVLETHPQYSLMQFELFSGRTHQIRVHMQHIGHPVFNDDFYGGDRIVKGTVYTKYKQFVDNCFQICPRHALHARELGFTHPVTGEPMMFDAPLPEDMQQLIDKWRRYSQFKNEIN